MDSQYNIYEATEQRQVLPEDAARLDGYLKAKAEEAKAAHDALVAEMEAEERHKTAD